MVNLAVFVDAEMDPGASLTLGWPFNDNPFTIFGPLVVAQVVVSAEGVHEGGAAEGR